MPAPEPGLHETPTQVKEWGAALVLLPIVATLGFYALPIPLQEQPLVQFARITREFQVRCLVRQIYAQVRVKTTDQRRLSRLAWTKHQHALLGCGKASGKEASKHAVIIPRNLTTCKYVAGGICLRAARYAKCGSPAGTRPHKISRGLPHLAGPRPVSSVNSNVATILDRPRSGTQD